MIGSRFVLIPVLAAVGYEVLRLGAQVTGATRSSGRSCGPASSSR